ncbi:MAG: hypothetical protein CL608_28460 [Anaerolineaceae bacterium]|nr:hypothetical protein [Anaerolineaceae bacterium]
MEFPAQYILFLILSPVVTIVSLGVILGLARRYPSRPTRLLTYLALTIAGWLVFNSLELAASSPEASVFWAKVSYTFITLTPVAWLAFALQYTGNVRWLQRDRFFIFFLVPVVVTLSAYTNELHQLLWREYIFTPVSIFLAFSVEHGPFFWLHIVHSYVLVFTGAFLIVRQALRTFAVYWRQASYLIVGALVPVVTNIFYLINPIPAIKKDYTPISFAISALVLTIGVVRDRLFDVRPVARDLLVDSMGDLMLALDRQGRIIDLNPAAEAALQIEARQIVGKTAATALATHNVLAQYIAAAGEVEDEINLEFDGRQHYFDLQISQLLNRRGQERGQLVVLRDITARKEAEAELQHYAAQLEARNRELDAYAHTVAHDLKNPVTAVVGYAEYLQEISSDAKAHAVADRIIQSGHKMQSIINELLFLSVVRTKDVAVEPLKMETIVAEAAQRLENDIAMLEAEIHYPSRWPAAYGHAPWVEEVWVNYLSNALKYGGRPPKIELGAEMLQAASNTVRYWVRDNGSGVAPDRRNRLFTLFERLDEAASDGHGLGLSIVHRIVTKLGGEVGIESPEGEGSLFWFTLPAEGHHS